MNQSITIGIASGLFQFGLACYAFRFARHLAKPRIGWSLFITLSFLAACTPLLSAKLHFEHIASAPGLNILYTAFSVFLFLGLARLDRTLGKYRRVDRRDSDETEVEELLRIKRELERRAGGLEKDVSEENEARKRLEDAYKDLVVSIGGQMPVAVNRSQAEFELEAPEPKALPQPEPAPQSELVAQSEPAPQPEPAAQPAIVPLPEPVFISHQPPSVVISLPESVVLSQPEPIAESAPLVELAPESELESQQPAIHSGDDIGQRQEIGILVNNVTASVSSLAEHLARCEKASASFSRLAKLINTHARNLSSFTDARSKQLPASLSQLSKQLADEQSLLAKQINLMKKRLTQINSALTIVPQSGLDHDSSTFSSGEATHGEEQFHYSLHEAQTETAVSNETESQESSSATVVHEASLDGELDEANTHSDDQGGDTGFIFR